MYGPNPGTPNFIKQILLDLKPKINLNTAIVVPSCLTFTIRKVIQTKIKNRNIVVKCQHKLEQMDVYRKFHPNTQVYTLWQLDKQLCVSFIKFLIESFKEIQGQYCV